MQNSNINTIKLRNGITVYAEINKKFGLCAKTYSNYTQAVQKELTLTAMGVNCSIYSPVGSCVKYIKIN